MKKSKILFLSCAALACFTLTSCNSDGILVESEDVVDLSAKIKLLIENKELRDSFGMLGRETVEHKFSLDKMCDSYERIYKELITNGKT